MSLNYSILIPTRNWANLEANVRALIKADTRGRIIILDDFDDVTRSLDIPGLTWIKAPKPFNFSRNMNIGIAAAGDDDVILWNDDCLLKTPSGLDRLHATMSLTDPELKVPFIDPHATAISSEELVSHVRRSVQPVSPFGAVSCLIAGMAAAPDQVYSSTRGIADGIRRVRHHMLAFMATYIPRAAITEVGLLDERFIGYGYEDDDYCRRLLNSGWQLGVFDGAIVDHNLTLPSTFRGMTSGSADLLSQNRAIFDAKWRA